MELRIHTVETCIDRCVDCPSASSPLNRPGDEWRCKQAADLDDGGNIIGHRVIPMVEAWDGFPAWCPLQKTSPQKWAKKELDRKIKRRAAGRIGRINPPVAEDW